MRVLLLGASGMLGRDLTLTIPSGFTLVSASERLDLRDPTNVAETMDRLGPELVVNAAAYTKVDRAEAEADLAEEVNGTAVGVLATACRTRGVRLVHFSTDYVFSGRGSRPYVEDDACEPVNAYGRSKLIGEVGIVASRAEALIIRTQWLFGRWGRSFPGTMYEKAVARAPTRVVDDQWGRPTYTRDLSAWTWELVDRGIRGVVHAANRGTTTWYDVARRIFERAEAECCLSRCATADFPTPAARPRYSVLGTQRLEGIIDRQVPPWEDALDRFLSELRAS